MPHAFAAILLAASSKKDSSNAGSTVLIVVVLACVLLYFMVLRPRQRRARGQQRGNPGLGVGDEVISAGGILGRVTAIAGDEVVVEVSPGNTLTFWRRAINLRTAVAGAPQSTTPPGGAGGFGDRPAGEGLDESDELYEEEPYEEDSDEESSDGEESYDEEPYDGADEDGDEEALEVRDSDEGDVGDGVPGDALGQAGNGTAAEAPDTDHRDRLGGPGEGR